MASHGARGRRYMYTPQTRLKNDPSFFQYIPKRVLLNARRMSQADNQGMVFSRKEA